MARDYYAILGVDHDASDNDIKRAYRRLARQYHPDVNGTPEAAQKFSDISIAQEVLLDPEKRRIVDMGGDPMAQGGGGSPGGFGGFGGGINDIFDAFFGGGGGARRQASRVQPGNDALLRVHITLEEAFAGVDKEITVDTAIVCERCAGTGSKSKSKATVCGHCGGSGEVQQVQRSFLGNVLTSAPCPMCRGYGEVIEDPCDQCGGDGRVRARRDKLVRIPAGIAEGMRVRMAGQGEVGPGGGPAGDLFIEVHLKPHPVFSREGDDLHVSLRVPMVEAALGASATVDGVGGEPIMVVVPAGSQPGDRVVVAGKGMPRLRAEGNGDVVAHIDVVVPTSLDDHSKELLEKLRSHREEKADVVGTASEDSFFDRLRNRFRK